MTGMNIVLAVLHQAVGALVVAAVAWGAHVDGAKPMSVVTVYAIFADPAEAPADRPTMVEERLAACVNILAAVPLDLPLGRRDRDGDRGPGPVQDDARTRPTR